MNKLSLLKEIYQREGFQSASRAIGRYILINSPVAHYLKSILGKRLHHKIYMYVRLGYWPNIKNPRTFNEKILHRKLYVDNNLFSTVEDKWQVRKYVIEKVGNGILPEIYHVTDEPDTIPFDNLPKDYVIKPTHMSGPVIFVDEEEEPDRASIKQSCREWIDTTYGSMKEEYWYSQIEPQIIIEERLKDESHEIPPDFKFFVFNGNVKYIEVDTDRYTSHKRRFYDRDWNPMEFELEFPLAPVIDEPKKLEEMICIAEKLGSDFDFIRVDLYEIGGERVVFGELTVAHGSGGEKFKPLEYDFEFGSYW